MTLEKLLELAKGLIQSLDKDITGGDQQRAAALRNLITPMELLDLVATVSTWHQGATDADTRVAILTTMVSNYETQLKNLATQVSSSAASKELRLLRDHTENLVMAIKDYAPKLREDPHIGKPLLALQELILK